MMIALLEDEHPLVRVQAVKGIGAIAANYPEEKLFRLAPMLKDSSLEVRSETARALTELPQELLTQAQQEDFKKALQEYVHRQKGIADRPESHLNLGVMHQNLGQIHEAESSYLNALQLAHDFSPARFNLANLYNTSGKNGKAELQLREIIALEPENGEAYYSLGLLLAEINRFEEAVSFLSQAADLLPYHPRVRYNYSLALRHLGRNQEADAEMSKLYRTEQ